MSRYLFTSESVSEGHPDKICDQISDAVLDACLSQDPLSRVGCESFITSNFLLVGGEITSNAKINIEEIARKVVLDIGYTNEIYGINGKTMEVINKIHTQSSDISIGVTEGEGLYHEQGAGDQGMMFGFACDETPELLPATVVYAHKILQLAAKLRKENRIDWMLPDSKSQVTIEYDGFTPKRIDTVVVSHQHKESASYETIKSDLINQVIIPALQSSNLLDEKTKFFINPTGRFVIGGPTGDAGLTGRKIIVDTYGGVGRHGGGAFSGKDSTKVDRSAAYMARYIAKNIVAAKLAKRCEIELAYAIGVAKPVSVYINCFNTAIVTEAKLEKAVCELFDLTPAGINKKLDLRKPIFQKTANYGHFGRDEFNWEKVDMVESLQKYIKSL